MTEYLQTHMAEALQLAGQYEIELCMSGLVSVISKRELIERRELDLLLDDYLDRYMELGII